MKKIAIIGAGPTGVYTFFSLLKEDQPLEIAIFERGREAGIGMPYGHSENTPIMLANIASIEVPPLFDTWLEWLQTQEAQYLAQYGVKKESLHQRQFLPRILLGDYFRAQFLHAVRQAENQGFKITLYESCEVTDVAAGPTGVQLWTDQHAAALHVDLAIIATGHVWPDDDESTRAFYPSPWSGLMEADVPAVRVGILGTSLSALDAAMAVAVQHGTFHETEENQVHFSLDKDSEALEITLMSRSGILPEADFYCPIPYEPLACATDEAITREIDAGSAGLLDRVFTLMQQELTLADPKWAQKISLSLLDADSFPTALFADRTHSDPFDWAAANLKEVEANKRDKHTVAWRYTLLRLHEGVQDIVAHLDEKDSRRFSSGLARVFIDNYAAIPSESIRRMLALHAAGILRILTLGQNYGKEIKADRTEITTHNDRLTFDVFIDARGQKPLKTADLPFPRLRRQLLSCGDDIPEVGDDYTLQASESVRGRIAFGALPYLMHDRPFIQGLVACQEIGTAMARAVSKPATRLRRRLSLYDA
ncbi:FAD-NAD(P)-binding protein [Citrobacter farmeri]|uniref:FAD-dependent urate hydroxylase HpyO/Asp monooxygenase CreE-like FAD/NAD(P)-binding domain-containing protein n=1 Tax=Citrobacter amalonaticus Y19 TaxID=1261127 RepID=A0A0F6TUI9_CITAM|nr:FAD-NAD(P)-binding protein [Citrobacter amalonaticus]AKE58801.1 hypothetical protein F384_06365 [Citrobacter amalonaticus Y19]EKV5654066.1 FAD-NAD(P)-binding protein [Citrobacter farmeri]